MAKALARSETQHEAQELEELKEELEDSQQLQVQPPPPTNQVSRKKGTTQRRTWPATWPLLFLFLPAASHKVVSYGLPYLDSAGREFWEMWFRPARPAYFTGMAQPSRNCFTARSSRNDLSNQLCLSISVEGGKAEWLRYGLWNYQIWVQILVPVTCRVTSITFNFRTCKIEVIIKLSSLKRVKIKS